MNCGLLHLTNFPAPPSGANLRWLHEKPKKPLKSQAFPVSSRNASEDIRILKRHVDELNELFLSGQVEVTGGNAG